MSEKEKKTKYSTDFSVLPPDIEEIEKRMKKQKIIMQSILVAVFLLAGLWVFSHQNVEIDYIDGNVIHMEHEQGEPFANLIVSPWKNASFHNSLLFSTLFVTDSSYTEVNAGLAEKYEVTNDGLIYTITMGNDLQWSDGTALTADDVLFSLEGFLSCEFVNSYLSSTFSNIVGALEYAEGTADSISGVAVNGNIITIELETPQSSFPLMLTQFTPLPLHALENVDKSTLTSEIDFFQDFNTICSGQFMVDYYDDQGNMVLSNNPYYYGTATEIEHVILHFDHESVDLDITNTTDPTKMVSYRSMKGYDEHMVEVLFYRYFLFNMESSEDGNGNTAMQDVRVRQAIYHALDVKTLFDEVYFSKGNLYYGGSLALAEEYCEYNPEKAKQLLEEAGYDFNRTFNIMYYSGDTSSRIFLEKVCGYLEAVGLKVEMTKAVTSTELYEEATYDMMMKNLSAFNTQDWYSEYLSTNSLMTQVFGLNYEFDDLFDELNGTTSLNSFNTVLEKLVALEQEVLYKMPMFLIGEAVYINSNRLFVPDDMVFGNTRYFSDYRLDEWYVKMG